MQNGAIRLQTGLIKMGQIHAATRQMGEHRHEVGRSRPVALQMYSSWPVGAIPLKINGLSINPPKLRPKNPHAIKGHIDVTTAHSRTQVHAGGVGQEGQGHQKAGYGLRGLLARNVYFMPEIRPANGNWKAALRNGKLYPHQLEKLE